MRRVRCLLIVLVAILNLGCAPRGDWISETLTLVDVSGTWEGTIEPLGDPMRATRSIRLVLRQRGARVAGEREGGSTIAPSGKIDGLVNGDVFTFTFQGSSMQGEAIVDGAQMSGRVVGAMCPCTIVLRRVGEGRLSGDER